MPTPRALPSLSRRTLPYQRPFQPFRPPHCRPLTIGSRTIPLRNPLKTSRGTYSAWRLALLAIIATPFAALDLIRYANRPSPEEVDAHRRKKLAEWRPVVEEYMGERWPEVEQIKAETVEMLVREQGEQKREWLVFAVDWDMTRLILRRKEDEEGEVEGERKKQGASN